MIFTDEEIREMYKEYASGLSLVKVCEKHYYSDAGALSARFKALGLEVRPKWRHAVPLKIQREDMPRIIEMRKAGETYRKIAKIYSVNAYTIYNAFLRYNVPLILTKEVEHEKYCKETHEMYELYKAGVSAIEIGLRYNISADAVRTRFRKMGLPVITRPKPQYNLIFTDDDIRRLYDEYTHGTSVRTLAARHNCGAETIYTRFKKMGLETLPPREKIATLMQSAEMPRMLEMRAQGKTDSEIAAAYGLSYLTVRSVFNHYEGEKQ